MRRPSASWPAVMTTRGEHSAGPAPASWSRRRIYAAGCRRAVHPKPALIVRFGLDGRLHTLPRFAQFTGEGLTSPNAAGTGTRFPVVGLREVAPANDLRKRPYLHDLLGIDPPLHHDLHAERIIGFHDDSNCRRG